MLLTATKLDQMSKDKLDIIATTVMSLTTIKSVLATVVSLSKSDLWCKSHQKWTIDWSEEKSGKNIREYTAVTLAVTSDNGQACTMIQWQCHVHLSPQFALHLWLAGRLFSLEILCNLCKCKNSPSPASLIQTYASPLHPLILCPLSFSLFLSLPQFNPLTKPNG